ncbi:hypothetical protein DXG03_002997 [Asterophora parasitica]|uniref:Uncharacterized protein n=1 Tax=Asterophora parasitica TaxID=117018 RepID=A0A9P7G7X0_9AGAR|nr:hypothetical protein DXG03_002997 [Asterophora parasitica]
MLDQELKKALSEPTSQLFRIVFDNLESLPTDIAPEALLTRHARLNSRVLRTWQRFEEILTTAPSATDPKEDMLDGMVVRTQKIRATIISERINEFPRPSKYKGADSDVNLYEMTFVPTDRFPDLSSLRPGQHGSLFTFREELKAWLLQSEGFRLVYESPDGQRTQHGVYKATLLPPSLNMIGPEFARLSNAVHMTRDIIVTHLSASQRGSDPYDAELRTLISSKKTLPCILLQCLEFPPGLYQSPGPRSTGSTPIHVEQRPQLTHPPELLVPPALFSKRQSASKTLLNTLKSSSSQASRSSPPYAPRPSTSAQMSRNAHSQALDDQPIKQPQTQFGETISDPMCTDKPQKVANGTPSLSDLPGGGHDLCPQARSGPLSTLSGNVNVNGDVGSHLQTGFVYDGRWFSGGKVGHHARGAPAGSQNWIQQPHQNLIPFDVALHQRMPFPQPIFLQSGMSNIQV